jgi:hypothetical protein
MFTKTVAPLLMASVPRALLKESLPRLRLLGAGGQYQRVVGVQLQPVLRRKAGRADDGKRVAAAGRQAKVIQISAVRAEKIRDYLSARWRLREVDVVAVTGRRAIVPKSTTAGVICAWRGRLEEGLC